MYPHLDGDHSKNSVSDLNENWLITYLKKDSDPSSKKPYRVNIKKTISLLAVVMLVAPFLANAGIFSFITGSNNTNNEVSDNRLNSQNVNVLKAATNNDPNPAKGGGDILVVDDKAIMAVPTISGDPVEIYKPKSDQISVYVVRDGDTLSQIANMFNVSANTIRWANDLSGEIQPGQQLVILPVTGVKHKVKSGGTVADLAEIYKADAREIALFNGISVNTRLEAGMEILVPNGELHVEEKKKTTTSVARSGASSNANKSAPRTSGGIFTHPVPGAVRTQGIHGYNAVDFGAPIGTPIYAAAGGQVIISRTGGWNGGYGNYVVIKHDNGSQTLYAHANTISVASGQWVAQGAQIATVGNTGRSTGPHLHFEVRGATNPF
jgi:murein DD-endopeptidase MepM/ murein hydrolase activator NlpD